MPVVADSLAYYWNAKDGVKAGNVLANIAPGGEARTLAITGGTYNAAGFILLDGIDDYLTLDTSGTIMNAPGSWTMEYIFYPLNNQDDGAYHELMNAGTYLDIDFSYPGMYQETYVGGNHLESEITDPAVIGPKLLHYVLRHDGATMVTTMHLNGVLRYTSPTLYGVNQWTRSGNAIVSINAGTSSTAFNLRFHALRFYGKALTNAEIATNYANGTEIGFDTPMVKIAEFKLQGVTIPVYNIANHATQSLRVQTANGLGFIPLVPTTDPAASKIRVRKGSTTLAMRL